METFREFKCLISSPSDCEQEKKACKEIIEKTNKGLAKHLQIRFSTFTWEDDVLPDFGSSGQNIIDQHIESSNYDVYIGIMKNRFGSPTEKYGSGTEHEFYGALDRKRVSSNSIPQILFFFGKELVDPESFDSIQYENVKQFKSKVEKAGLYTSYDSVNNFAVKLEQSLNLLIAKLSPLDNPEKKAREVDLVLRRLEDDLNDSLKTYREKSPVWIDPIISSKQEIPSNPTKNDDHRIHPDSIVDNPRDIIIKAPSEFGLSSLAHFLKLEAWKKGKVFIYIDAKKTKKHKVVRDIYLEAETNFFTNANTADCILLDSVCLEESGMMQMIKNVCDSFPSTPLIILNTLDNNFFLKSAEDDKVQIKRSFTSFYLLPLPQTEVRKIVTTYAILKSFEEDGETTLVKVTKDLEALNMHRTVKNCISILRASSRIGSEYSPINRTKLLETILSTIFQDYDLPTYHDKKPDVKDCSFVLGYLCEILVLRNDFEFTDEYFKEKLSSFCKEKHIEVDLSYLLNVLKDNSILGRKNPNINYFKNSYWVFYFIAQRMNMSKHFREIIYKERKYVDFPEIIEFYTGIDRNKEDALHVLIGDLKETLMTVRSKVMIPDNLNPFKNITWHPDSEELEKEEAKIGENVISSGLPDEVKDKYEDKHYDQIRPYNQVINSVIRDYSFLVLMKQISATSRALRNSDFVNDSDLKIELLDTILQGWNEINKLLIVLSPLLADKGNVAFEGAKFYLDEEDFQMQDPVQKRLAVLLAVPTNVVRYFKDDLYSVKMAPLLINKTISETNTLLKHELMLMIIAERPKKWRETVDSYIVSLDKNSYFLSDVLQVLNFNVDYKATELEDIKILKMLAKKCRAKHLFKSNNPDLGLINRLDKMDKGGKFI